MKRILLAALCILILTGILPAQVVTVSTNPKAVAPTADSYVVGGTITLTFDREYNSLYPPSTPRIVVTLDRPDILFDVARPPRSYKNDWTLNGLNVIPSPYEIAVELNPRMYGESFRSLTIEGFTLDVLDAKLKPGDVINAQVQCSDAAVSFTNPTFRLFRVAVPATGRR